MGQKTYNNCTSILENQRNTCKREIWREYLLQNLMSQSVKFIARSYDIQIAIQLTYSENLNTKEID